MKIIKGRIDVHHHNIPTAFREEMGRRGIKHVAGAPLPDWKPENSISVMDKNGIQTAITSLSAPGVHFGSGEAQASELARRCNEFSAEITPLRPNRLLRLNVIPWIIPAYGLRLNIMGLVAETHCLFSPGMLPKGKRLPNRHCSVLLRPKNVCKD